MTQQRKTGAYYTPISLAKFIVEYLCSCFAKKKSLSALEPSFGGSVFLQELIASSLNNKIKIDAIELNHDEYLTASKTLFPTTKNITLYNQDYLNWHFDHSKKYDLIIGNPPYIKKNILGDEQRILCNLILEENPFHDSRSHKNIWQAFLVSAIQKVNDTGSIAFILPNDLIQVDYASPIRKYLEQEFERIEVFKFEEKVFDETGAVDQDTLLLIAHKKASKKGSFFITVDNWQTIEPSKLKYQKLGKTNSDLFKWKHDILSSKELKLLEKLQKKFPSINNYIKSAPGIVTAANDFFIVNDSTLEQFDLDQYSQPIVRKSTYVNGHVDFALEDLEGLRIKDKPCHFLNFTNAKNVDLKHANYLKKGVSANIHQRYKCKLRKHWYVVPNIGNIPEAFFFKRSHKYPKLVSNSANAYVTDTAYKVYAKEGFLINSIVYSFYNIITLTFAELLGRHYGGGVLELTPSEFKSLPIAFHDISKSRFTHFKNLFHNQTITEVLEDNFQYSLQNMEITLSDFNQLITIREKLLQRRLG